MKRQPFVKHLSCLLSQRFLPIPLSHLPFTYCLLVSHGRLCPSALPWPSLCYTLPIVEPTPLVSAGHRWWWPVALTPQGSALQLMFPGRLENSGSSLPLWLLQWLVATLYCSFASKGQFKLWPLLFARQRISQTNLRAHLETDGRWTTCLNCLFMEVTKCTFKTLMICMDRRP
jgi:hypothetical protein